MVRDLKSPLSLRRPHSKNTAFFSKTINLHICCKILKYETRSRTKNTWAEAVKKIYVSLHGKKNRLHNLLLLVQLNQRVTTTCKRWKVMVNWGNLTECAESCSTKSILIKINPINLYQIRYVSFVRILGSRKLEFFTKQLWRVAGYFGPFWKVL